MDETIASAMTRGGIADVTTTGRKSGRARRTEIYFHHFDDRYFLTGKAGARDWVANLNVDPEFTLHLKRGITADVPVVARHVTDPGERERIIYRCLTESWGRDEATARGEMPDRIANGVLIEFAVRP
jgi:deazaflavin-dependent oxidoreductase (nitroreductase family)